jgi:hypothetical protein
MNFVLIVLTEKADAAVVVDVDEAATETGDFDWNCLETKMEVEPDGGQKKDSVHLEMMICRTKSFMC